MTAAMEMTETQGRRYCDFQGRVLYVSPALTNGTTWMTVYSKDNGSLKRVKSKWLPLRETREEAQADLGRYAEGRGLGEVRNG